MKKSEKMSLDRVEVEPIVFLELGIGGDDEEE